MADQKRLFTLKEVINPRHTLTSFGYKSVLSPDNNTIVVIDPENSFISIYIRDTMDTNSPFILSNKFSKPEFKYQYILTDVAFSRDSTQCYISIKYCDYVNYDTEIRRLSFLSSIIVFIRQKTQIPKRLENTIIYEPNILWSYFTTLPYPESTGYDALHVRNGYELLHAGPNNNGIYALTRTYGEIVKIFYQPLTFVNNAILSNTSDMLLVDKPVFLEKLGFIKNIKFSGTSGTEVDTDCVLFQYQIDSTNLYKMNISSTGVSPIQLIARDVYNFNTTSNSIVCDRGNRFDIIDVKDLFIKNTFIPEIIDTHGILAINPYQSKIVHITNTTNQLKIYQEDPTQPNNQSVYSYSNNFPYTYASLNYTGTTLILGQPKNGKVLIFNYNNGWTLFQELSLLGYSHSFDIDSQEKTLILSNSSERTTEIYENITNDLSQFYKDNITILNEKIDKKSIRYYESVSLGFKNMILDNKEFNTGALSVQASLYSNLPYYVTFDGNMMFSIYESQIDYNNIKYYVYHVHANDISGTIIDRQSRLVIYTEPLDARLESITSDRNGDTVLLLRDNNSVEIYKRVNIDPKEEIYVNILQDSSKFSDLWKDYEYGMANFAKPIYKIHMNPRGNIIIVEQDTNIILLHFEQELMFRLQIVGNPSMGTTPSDSLIQSPKTEDGYDYKYFLNYYYLMSKPNVSFIMNETFLSIDGDENVYTWKDDSIHIYSENNMYRNKIKDITFSPLYSWNVKFHPEESLFTYKDNTNIYIYYYDKIANTFINTNVTLPVSEKYDIIQNHIIQYSNKNINIQYYTIDVIQNRNVVDFSYNTVYTDSIQTLMDFAYYRLDYRNGINLFFKGTTGGSYYRYTPTSNKDRKYKYITTFREQKIDSDIQYKHEEFYNNVIQVIPENYISSFQYQSQNRYIQNESQFKIFCPQKFVYSTETTNGQVHTFVPDFNKDVFYSNQMIVSKYFNPKEYTKLNSVLSYMNQVNMNRSTSLYKITPRRYVGILTTMNGGQNLVRYKYTWINQKEDIVLIHTPPYNQQLSEGFSTRGIKYFGDADNTETYRGNVVPEEANGMYGIYIGAEVSVEDEIKIRYDIDYSFVPPGTTGTVYHPTNIEIYIMTELTIDIITEETVQNSSYLIKDSPEYGKFTKISPDGNLAVITSELNTLSNISPSNNPNKRTFRIHMEQAFAPPEAIFTTYDEFFGEKRKADRTDHITYTINWDKDFNYDQDLEKLLDVKTNYNRIYKLEEYVNKINTYYGVELIKLKDYINYYAIQVYSDGGLYFRRIRFKLDNGVNSLIFIRSRDYSNWNQDETLTSPYNLDEADGPVWTGVTPSGARFKDNNYCLYSRGVRDNSFKYLVWTGGGDVICKNIIVSYVFNCDIEFTEEYFQRYYYNVIKYGCLFYYVKKNGRWRHLNTLYTKNSTAKTFRNSMSLTSAFYPEKLEIIYNKYLLISKNTTSLIIQNYKLYDQQIESFENYYQSVLMEFSIDYNVTFKRTTKTKGDYGDVDYYFEGLLKYYKIFNIYNNSSDIITNLLSNEIYSEGLTKFEDFNFVGIKGTESYDRSTDEIYKREVRENYYKNNFIVMVNNFFSPQNRLFINTNGNYINKIILYNDFYKNGNTKNEVNLDKGEDYIGYNGEYSNGTNIVDEYSNLKCNIKFSEAFARAYGLSEFVLTPDNILYLSKLPHYRVFVSNPYRQHFGSNLKKSDNIVSSSDLIMGCVDKFEIFENGIVLKTKFSIKDKIGNLYINNDTVYNAIPEKGLIRKYPIPALVTPDPSYNIFPTVQGTQVFQDYNYLNFGNTFSIFKDTYAVIGTTEGKVIIQHLTDKSAAKGVIDSGSSSYSKFGSTIKSGESIYINAPELNKLYILSDIPYYE
jgi:hypothetical protein